MSAQIEERKNQMITELTSSKTECSLWERSKISLNKEYQRKILEAFRSTRENIARGTKTEPIKPTARQVQHRGVKYIVNSENEAYDITTRFYVGFWIPSESAVFFEEDDTDDEEDDEDEDIDEEEEKIIVESDEEEEKIIKTPKQPANPLGLSLEFPIVQEDDENILCAKYEYELDQEMLLMKEKVIELDREYSRRIGVLDKRILVLSTRIAELEAMIVKFGSQISSMKMKKIKELTEMANIVWMNR
jgi:hypothetical protein